MKAEPIMGEKYRGKKVSRKQLEKEVNTSHNAPFYNFFIGVPDVNSDSELLRWRRRNERCRW